MNLLDFSVPEKVKIDAGFEDGPDGGYVPQMSVSDAARWKAKKFNIGKPNGRIELRKSFGATQVFIIVALDGWDLSNKNEYIASPKNTWGTCTRGKNVRISMNGSLHLTFEQFHEIDAIVTEAKEYLQYGTDSR